MKRTSIALILALGSFAAAHAQTTPSPKALASASYLLHDGNDIIFQSVIPEENFLATGKGILNDRLPQPRIGGITGGGHFNSAPWIRTFTFEQDGVWYPNDATCGPNGPNGSVPYSLHAQWSTADNMEYTATGQLFNCVGNFVGNYQTNWHYVWGANRQEDNIVLDGGQFTEANEPVCEWGPNETC